MWYGKNLHSSKLYHLWSKICWIEITQAALFDTEYLLFDAEVGLENKYKARVCVLNNCIHIHL